MVRRRLIFSVIKAIQAFGKSHLLSAIGSQSLKQLFAKRTTAKAATLRSEKDEVIVLSPDEWDGTCATRLKS